MNNFGSRAPQGEEEGGTTLVDGQVGLEEPEFDRVNLRNRWGEVQMIDGGRWS